MNNNPNRKKADNFDPFMLSLLTENQNQMDPMLSMMMMNNKDMSQMGPLLPLFFAGKTKKDPLLMTMLMSQQANPSQTRGNSGIKNLLPLLQMMSNSCDYGGQKCTCNHDPADMLMMMSLISGMEKEGQEVDMTPFMFMMWDPVPGCIGTLPEGEECICGTGGPPAGPTGEKRDNTMAKLLPYLIISGTGKDDMPDMSLIAEAIMDPEGKSAGGFFTDMGRVLL